jgi:hypothetical protein
MAYTVFLMMTTMILMMTMVLYNPLNIWHSELFFVKYSLWYHCIYLPSLVIYIYIHIRLGINKST